eukprot:scaffold1913_cov257-Pinguiococcus_pyrenoidosus.AAC.20
MHVKFGKRAVQSRVGGSHTVGSAPEPRPIAIQCQTASGQGLHASDPSIQRCVSFVIRPARRVRGLITTLSARGSEGLDASRPVCNDRKVCDADEQVVARAWGMGRAEMSRDENT